MQATKGNLDNMPNTPYWHSLLPEGKPVQIEADAKVFEQPVEVAIIGGGLTGMSCALHCLKAGLSVIVLEARGLADGATGRNGGHQWPEEFGRPNVVAIENHDVKETRKFISGLSAEWQKKISLQVCGALWPFSDSEEGDREFITTNLPNVKNLESKFKVLDTPKDDSDLPEYAADGGYVASIAAKLNPG